VTTLTLDQATARCADWQRLLRLQDWDVEVRLERRHAMPIKTAVGCSSINKYRRAVIQLVDPIDFTADDCLTERDMEATLVHELLHLHFYDLNVPTPDQAPENVALERAIEAIARGLVALDRAAGGNA